MIKNILMITPGEYPPDIRIKKEIQTLLNMGKRVNILTANLKDRKRIDDFKGARIFRIKYIPWRIFGFIFGKLINHPFPLNPIWLYYIAKASLESNAEALHVHDLPLVLPAIFIGKVLGIPVVFDSHENYPEYLEFLDQPKSYFNFLFNNPRFYKVIQKIILKLINDVIVVIPQMGERYLKNNKLKIHIIPNYCSRDFFNKGEKIAYKVGKPLKLAYLGGLDPSRGLFELLGIMKEIKELPVELHIAGSGVSYQKLRDISISDGLKVNFYGYLEENEVIRFLSNCHIGVIPHPKTAQGNNSNPNKLSEYACFMPIISRRLSSIEKIFDKNDMGYLFDYKEGLISLIKHILENPDILYKKRVNARNFAKNHLFEDIAEKVFSKLYD